MQHDESSTLTACPAASSRLMVVFVLLWLALGFFLLLHLTDRPLTRPEIESIRHAGNSFSQSIRHARQFLVSPLFPAIAGLLKPFTPERAIHVRYVAVLFGWLALFSSFWLMQLSVRTKSPLLLFPLLFATSPFWIQMSRMATENSLFAFCAITSTAFLFQALARPRAVWWVGYTFFTILLLYAGWLAPAVLAGQLLAALIRKHWTPERKTFGRILIMLLCMVICLMAYLPWMNVLIHRFGESREYSSAARIGIPALQHAAIGTAYTVYMFMFGDSVAPWNVLRTVLLSVPALLGAMFGLARIFEHHHRTLRSVLLCALGAYAFAVFLIEYYLHDTSPLMAPLRLAFVYPFFCLAGAYGFGVMNRTLAVPLFIIVLSVHGYSLLNYYHAREYTNWVYAVPVHETQADLAQWDTPGALLVIDEPPLSQLHYYAGLSRTVQALPLETPREVVEVSSWSRHKRLLVLHMAGEYWIGQTLAADFKLIKSISYMREDAVANEVKSFLSGRFIPLAKYQLDVYERKEKTDSTTER